MYSNVNYPTRVLKYLLTSSTVSGIICFMGRECFGVTLRLNSRSTKMTKEQNDLKILRYARAMSNRTFRGVQYITVGEALKFLGVV